MWCRYVLAVDMTVKHIENRTTDILRPNEKPFNAKTFWKDLMKYVRLEMEKTTNKSGRIRLMKSLSKIVIKWKRPQPLAIKRDKFDANERLKRMWGRKCWVCKRKKATARHHIILLSLGGRNDKKNVIPICNDCHCEIHPWMKD